MRGRATPFLLPASAGALYAIYYPPDTGLAPLGHVLHVPAFAEEMNKSRRMVTCQCLALASQGLGVLVVDLFATGDSDGDFGEARWDIWKADLQVAVKWLRERHPCGIRLWGLRLGCLLALDFAQDAQAGIDGFVFWQPVTSGRLLMTQFLRLKVAAGVMGRGNKQTADGLREKLAAGSPIEVAGYELAPELLLAIDELTLSSRLPPRDTVVDWLEVVPTADRSLLPASQKVIEDWGRAGARVAARTAVGEPFWTTQEITEAPTLVRQTTAALMASTGGGVGGDRSAF